MDDKEELKGYDEYYNILNEYSKERIEYDDMLNSIKKFRQEAWKVVPGSKSGDYRGKKYSKFEMEEKLRIISNVYSTELSIRKAKTDNYLKEIELKRKLAGEDKDDDTKYSDVVALAKSLEKLEGKKFNPSFDG
jgi:hypothetical protein